MSSPLPAHPPNESPSIFRLLFQWLETPCLQQNKKPGRQPWCPLFPRLLNPIHPQVLMTLPAKYLFSLSVSQLFYQHFPNHHLPLGVLWWALMGITFPFAKCLQMCFPFCHLSNLLSQKSTNLTVSFLCLKHLNGSFLSSVSSQLPPLSPPETPFPSQGLGAPSPFRWGYFLYLISVTSPHREALPEGPRQGWLPVTRKHPHLSFTALIRCNNSSDISVVSVSTCLLGSTLN